MIYELLLLEQQRELDAWVAENEKAINIADENATRPVSDDWVNGYNAGSTAAAEAIRQGNWTWEDYQQHLKAMKIGGN